jgi:hypothetical protein
MAAVLCCAATLARSHSMCGCCGLHAGQPIGALGMIGQGSCSCNVDSRNKAARICLVSVSRMVGPPVKVSAGGLACPGCSLFLALPRAFGEEAYGTLVLLCLMVRTVGHLEAVLSEDVNGGWRWGEARAGCPL